MSTVIRLRSPIPKRSHSWGWASRECAWTLSTRRMKYCGAVSPVTCCRSSLFRCICWWCWWELPTWLAPRGDRNGGRGVIPLFGVVTVSQYLLVGAILFVVGAVCMATKRNAMGVLMGVELVLNG